MLEIKPQTSESPIALCARIPGKIFLLGEYAVLQKTPAMVAALPPFFTIQKKERPPSSLSAQPSIPSWLHPDSPAGQYYPFRFESTFDISFKDPHQGRGGFGASTAQFALLYALQNPKRLGHWKECWKAYQEIHHHKTPLPPSGADLATQIQGGIQLFYPPTQHQTTPECEPLSHHFKDMPFLIFSATQQFNRKISTHEHLATLHQEGFPQVHSSVLLNLRKIIERSIQSLDEQKFSSFAEALNQYAHCLQDAGWEHPQTTHDRHYFRSLPGVVAVKGAGALQADALLVLIDPDHFHQSTQLLHEAQARGLQLISYSDPTTHSHSFFTEEGLQCHTQ